MKYPILLLSRCEQLADLLIEGQDPSVDPHVTWVGTEEEVNLAPLRIVADEVDLGMRDLPPKADRDHFEGQMAPFLYQAVAEIPFEVLDDKGFWRYLSISMFWDFIAWREESAFEARHHKKYVNAQTSTEAVLPRMYLRAKAVGGDGYAELTSAFPKATDFWRSHIIRVQTGTAPSLTRAFVEMQRDKRLTTGPLRSLARNLNRTWSNVVLTTYNDEEAAALIRELRDDLVIEPEPEID